MPRLSSLSPPLELPLAEVNALNSVGLRLYFGNHAFSDAIPGHGMAETRVEDADYAGLEPMINGFNAERGDVFAREAHGFDREWNLESYLSTLLDWNLRDSPYLSPSDRESLSIPLRGSALIEPTDTAIFLKGVEKLRALWLVNPIDYASIHALVKGVPCRCADISQAEESGWWNEAAEIAAAYPKIAIPYLRHTSTKAEFNFRNIQIVSKLGSIASTMLRPTGEEVPVLNYAAGGKHRVRVERLLDGQGVAYTSNTFSPDRGDRYRRDTLRDVGHLIVRKIDSSDARYKKLWIANARRHQANI